MPKGDRLKLKADPEDGTTPIANLLLEAVAMAKISGLQKGAILFLWRKTYGWVDKDGKRLKECKITLTEWKKALDSTAPRLSRTLTELEEKGIIKRRVADMWGGYFYSLNTNIAKWNSNCINLAKLADTVGIADFATVTENDNSYQNEQQLPKTQLLPETERLPKKVVTVTENATQQLPKTQLPTLYKEILNKDINKEGDVLEKQSPPNELREVVNKIIEKSPYGEGIRQVFVGLSKRRGYKTPKNQAEAKSIRNMLKEGYTHDQILDTWEKLKADDFWQGKELFMMSVEKQIGAILKDGTHKRGIGKVPEKYSKDKWGREPSDPNYGRIPIEEFDYKG